MGGATGDAREVRLLRGLVPAVLTETLGVLGESQTEAVELPDQAVARLGFSEVWIDATRRIFTSSKLGWRVFLIPGVRGDVSCLPRAGRARVNPGEPLVGLDIYEHSDQVGARAYSVDDIVAGRAVLVFPLFAADDHELVDRFRSSRAVEMARRLGAAGLMHQRTCRMNH